MLHRELKLHHWKFHQSRWMGAGLIVALVAALLLPLGQVAVAQAQTQISGPVVVRPGGAQLYSAPGGDVIATLPTAAVFTASGRTEDMQWVVGQTANHEIGWLQVSQLLAVGVELLPVYGDTAAVAAPAVAPTVAPASVPTEGTPAQSPTADAAAAQNPVAQQAPAQGTPANSGVSAGEASTTAIPSAPATGAPASATGVTGTVTSGTDRLNVRSGPGTGYAIVAKAMPGESFPVVGRSADGAWLLIERENKQTGWVSATYLQVTGALDQLPIIAVESPPAATTPVSYQTAAPSGAAVSGLSGVLVIESSPGGMIYGYSLASGATWQLTNGFDPAISPDGQTVAFARAGGENGIYLVDIDGSHERLIFSGRARLSSPKWSPDGQWILFTRSDDAYHCIPAGGSCITPGGGPGGPGGGFALPDVETTTRYWYNLARVDRDGNNYRDIPSLTSARAADWNEAGIVYESTAGLQITQDADADANKLVIFDYLKPWFSDPDWQPQGGKIVYMGKEASHWELFAVNPDGSGKVALTQPATTLVDVIPSNVAPAWSPDGQHIAFLSNREDSNDPALYEYGDDPGTGPWRVWVMDADGSNQHPLAVDVAIDYTFGGEQSISWAP